MGRARLSVGPSRWPLLEQLYVFIDKRVPLLILKVPETKASDSVLAW